MKGGGLDMARKESVLSRLLQYINGAYKKDTNYHIALKLITAYKKIPNMTIIETSELCNVSTASVSRFIRLLGYETFSEFKIACSNALDIRSTDYSAMVLKANKEDLKSIFERYTNSVLENIKFTYDNIDYQQIDNICRMLFESKDIALFGSEFSSLLGLHLQNRMSLMSKFVKIGFSYEKQLEIAKSLKQNAVVIVATIEGGYFYRNVGILDVLK